MFQAFLSEAAKSVSFSRPINILVLDNASWHRKKSLNWYGWQPLHLPAYSPDFNPIERIWLVIKARWFNHYVCRSFEQLLQRLDQAILDVIRHPEQTEKTAAIGTLF